MQRAFMPLFFAATIYALSLAQPCSAMLVTPANPDAAINVLNAAIDRRAASELSPASFQRAKERLAAARVDAFKSSDGAARFAMAEESAAENDSAERQSSLNITAACMAVAFPWGLYAFLAWRHRRAIRVRERECESRRESQLKRIAARSSAHLTHVTGVFTPPATGPATKSTTIKSTTTKCPTIASPPSKSATERVLQALPPKPAFRMDRLLAFQAHLEEIAATASLSHMPNAHDTKLDA
jgi:hypothetical protein